MPTTNARGHVIPSASDTSVSRATIFQEFGESIRDIVPVANTTARSTLVSTLTTAGEAPSSTKPLFVYRHDAPGMHRIEWTIDGTVWVPFTGVMSFASTAARDTWTTSNSAYLTAGDKCQAAGFEYIWISSQWMPTNTWQTYTPSSATITVGAGSSVTRWKYEAGRIRVHVRFTIGSGGNISGTAKVALPVARAALSRPYQACGELGSAWDDSITTAFLFPIIADVSSTTVVQFGYGIPQITGGVTNASPFAINSNDVYEANFTYEPA